MAEAPEKWKALAQLTFDLTELFSLTSLGGTWISLPCFGACYSAIHILCDNCFVVCITFGCYSYRCFEPRYVMTGWLVDEVRKCDLWIRLKIFIIQELYYVVMSVYTIMYSILCFRLYTCVCVYKKGEPDIIFCRATVMKVIWVKAACLQVPLTSSVKMFDNTRRQQWQKKLVHTKVPGADEFKDCIGCSSCPGAIRASLISPVLEWRLQTSWGMRREGSGCCIG